MARADAGRDRADDARDAAHQRGGARRAGRVGRCRLSTGDVSRERPAAEAPAAAVPPSAVEQHSVDHHDVEPSAVESEPVDAPVEPEPPGRGGAERAARASSPLREWPLVLVLAVAAVGLVVVVAREFKSGAFVVGLAPLLAASLRAVLPTRDVGLLAVRGRFVDVVTMLVLGIGLTTLAVAVPAGH